MDETHVHFLGSGDAFCAMGRHQAGYLVRSAAGTFLLDCGATTLASLKRDGIPPGAIDAIFLSHLHGDHFAGLPFFMLEYTFLEPRRRPLVIAGPPGTEQRAHALYTAMYPDASTQTLPFPIEFIEMQPLRPTHVGEAEIFPFRVPHQEVETSLGMRVCLDRRSILYSGDTGWTEDLVRHSQGADIFICECSLYETRMSTHLDYPRLAENRHRFGTGRLILTHLGREVLVRRAELEIETASDGLIVELR